MPSPGYRIISDAVRFVEQNHERSVMGDIIECMLDPFCESPSQFLSIFVFSVTKLDQRYSDCVGSSLEPLPPHLKHISSWKLQQKRMDMRRVEREFWLEKPIFLWFSGGVEEKRYHRRCGDGRGGGRLKQ